MLLKLNIFAMGTCNKKTNQKMTITTCNLVLFQEWPMLHVSTTERQKTAKRLMELSEEKIYFILLKLDKFN